MFRGFGGFGDDIFGQMDRMMESMLGFRPPGMPPMMDPFGMANRQFQPAIMDAQGQHQQQQQRQQQLMVSPFQQMMSFDPFGQFGNFGGGGAVGGGSSFMSSQVVTFSNDGRNPPQVYEQTHVNQVGPNGVREERRTVRDSRTGLQQMSIGRHINERGHVIEKKKNHYTGDEEENNEYINIEEEEAPEFQQEFSSRMASAAPPHYAGRHQGYLQAGPSHRQHQPMLAIAAPPANVEAASTSTSSSSSPSEQTRDRGAANREDKKLRIKPHLMKKEKKSKKSSNQVTFRKQG